MEKKKIRLPESLHLVEFRRTSAKVMLANSVRDANPNEGDREEESLTTFT